MPSLTVIGIGNDHRGDDGAGRVAVRQLRDVASDINVLEQSGEGASLIDSWKDAEFVILVDASRVSQHI